MENQTSSCQCSRSNNFFLVTAFAVFSLVSGFVGAFANSYFFRINNNQSIISYPTTGLTDISLKQKEAIVINERSNIPEELLMLNGIVKEIKGGQIILDISRMNLPQDPSFDYRTITVNGTTKISKVTMKDEKMLQTEMKNMKVSSSTPLVDPFIATPVKLSNIVVGDVLSVTSSENIKSKKEFTADRIDIMPKVGAK